MRIIEASATRSFTLKVAKADYKGEERYRPNEDVMVVASLRASIGEDEDGVAARKSLQSMVEEDVRLGVQVAREEARKRLEEALNPQRADPKPVPAPAALPAAPPAAPAPPPVPVDPNHVKAETRAALREAIKTLGEIVKQELSVEAPKTQAEAEKLLDETQKAILEMGEARQVMEAKGKDGRPNWFEGHLNLAYRQGKDALSSARRCSHMAGNRACNKLLDAAGYNYSINACGKPLCKDHDCKAQRR